MKGQRFGLLSLLFMLCFAMLVPAGVSAAESAPATVTTDGDTAGKLGLLLGDGNGVTADYLKKSATRIQAAIISLRLQGHLAEAEAFKGKENFSDASSVGTSNQAVLAYLKAHPELGWNGTGGGKFMPLEKISSQQLYNRRLPEIVADLRCA
ncbi:hypothetical protein [Paenibacillus glycinis]|uniref:Uncharacterized protein n=1 Tax=Paenibacillus glycinis TaxID=2697035 RepID=A0ABW9XSY6_9BACL|nr:hypothetical protein [Paenibacillus glycinis]NBD25778.1 hypothetical protein [Paenibacillus glycinis]